MQLPIQYKGDLLIYDLVSCITGIFVTLPPFFVEEGFPADPKGHYLAAWEGESLS